MLWPMKITTTPILAFLIFNWFKQTLFRFVSVCENFCFCWLKIQVLKIVDAMFCSPCVAMDLCIYCKMTVTFSNSCFGVFYVCFGGWIDCESFLLLLGNCQEMIAAKNKVLIEALFIFLGIFWGSLTAKCLPQKRRRAFPSHLQAAFKNLMIDIYYFWS